MTIGLKSMALFPTTPPLSLYIHIPWCLKKCPYCDFNSHQYQGDLPEQTYIAALIDDLAQDLARLPEDVYTRPIKSIFIGGGTPSLFSAKSLNYLLEYVSAELNLVSNVEITLEANPGTLEQRRFRQYRQIGINRLSIGVQSFKDKQLKLLGRVHNSDEARLAIELADYAGFKAINVDLMHGLPQQSLEDALSDLRIAIEFNLKHLSWYQLTIEPNTIFYKFPPKLPKETTLEQIEQQGKALLAQAGYHPYEVSAYCKPSYQCQHNLNYWLYGDYLGIGAGAHSKITDTKLQQVTRFRKTKQPNDYLHQNKPYLSQSNVVSNKELIFEFFLNTLRLNSEIPFALFRERTGINLESIRKTLVQAADAKFIHYNDQTLTVTEYGHRYLDYLTAMFLPNK